MSGSINFLGVLSVAGICFIVKYIRRKIPRETVKEEKKKREYQPTLQDRRMCDGGKMYIANVMGQPRRGSV